MEYRVNTSNKFAFLSEDEDAHDPVEILSNLEQQKAKILAKQVGKKIEASVEKKVTIVVPPPVFANNKENVERRGPHRHFNNQNAASRGNDRREGGGNLDRRPTGPRAPRRSDGNQVIGEGVENRPPRRFNNNGPRSERPQGEYRSVRSNRFCSDYPPIFDSPAQQLPDNQAEWNNSNPNELSHEAPRGIPGVRTRRPPRREGAERNSGSDKTGVRSFPKKDGHGKGNWGNEGEEANVEAAALEKLSVNAGENLDSQNSPTGDEGTGDEGNKTEEEVKKELTFEEYKAQCKSEQPQFKLRKAGEGGDQKIYQKLVPINKRNPNTVTDEEEEVQVKREPREKVLDIDLSFRDSLRNRGGRGGFERDGPRGSGYRPGGGNENNGRGYQQDRRSGGGNFRGGSGAGPRRFPEGSGGARRPPQTNFHLRPESFPALGAA